MCIRDSSRYVNVCVWVLTAPIDGISRARKQVLKWNLQIQNHNWQGGRGRKCTREGKDLQKVLYGTNPASAQNGGTRRWTLAPKTLGKAASTYACLLRNSLNKKCHSRPMQGKVYSKVTCCDAAFTPWSKAVMFPPNRCSTFSRCSKWNWHTWNVTVSSNWSWTSLTALLTWLSILDMR